MKKVIGILVALCAVGILVGTFVVRSRAPEIRHIVLISIDTCRADYLSCYGYPRSTTPNIDAVAAHATQFDYAVSPVPITLPAHSSMLTGRTPPSHGVHHNFGYQLAESNEMLPELLRSNQFKTAGIVSAYVLHSQFGINQGFDSFNDSFSENHRSDHGVERVGDETTRLALDWLDTVQDEKSFLFLHYYDPHYTYAPPEPFASKFADDLYAGEIAFTDHCIGQVIQKLKDKKMYDSTLLIIVGDHGEMLGEHGEETHTFFIYESAIRVPFIVKLPGQREGGIVSEPTGLVDIVPTICSLLDIDTPAQVQGVDLSPFLAGTVPVDYQRYLYSESVSPTRFNASTLMAISTGRFKYIQAPRSELYDVVADPGETNNLVEVEPQRARILEDKLREILEQSVRKDSDSQMELDSESIKRLESLGYVAGKEEGEIIFDESKGDPKDFVHLVGLIHQVKMMIENKEYESAQTILQGIMPLCPEVGEIYLRTGEIGMLRGDYETAVVNYRRAYEIDPGSLSAELFNNLAWVQATRPSLPSGSADEALKYAMTVCEQTRFKDPHTLDTLSVAYAAAGDFPKAIETAKKAWGIAIKAENKAMIQKLNERLKLFKQSKPFIEG